MKGICPDCGYAGDLISFISGSEAREAMRQCLKIMPDMENIVFRYIGMFRPATNALTMSRTVALFQQIANDMAAGRIERHGRKWPAPRDNWKAAMEQMIDARANITLPLKSHGYLHEILMRMANGVEAKQEAKKESERKSGQHRRTAKQEQTQETKQKKDTRKKELQATNPDKAKELIGGLVESMKAGN